MENTNTLAKLSAHFPGRSSSQYTFDVTAAEQLESMKSIAASLIDSHVSFDISFPAEVNENGAGSDETSVANLENAQKRFAAILAQSPVEIYTKAPGESMALLLTLPEGSPAPQLSELLRNGEDLVVKNESKYIPLLLKWFPLDRASENVRFLPVTTGKKFIIAAADNGVWSVSGIGGYSYESQ